MTDAEPPSGNRLERRKMRTRAALIRAAQGFIAAGKLNAPVLEITQAADVGMGSFYNHFDSKDQLFEAAVNEILDELGALLDKLTIDGEDPAATFARSFRLVGRLFGQRPEMCRVLLNTGLTLIFADRGLAPRALRDIEVAASAGRFAVADPQLALSVAGGALMGAAQLLQNQPERDSGEVADRATRDVLIMLGLAADEADDICTQPLPDLDELTEEPGSFLDAVPDGDDFERGLQSLVSDELAPGPVEGAPGQAPTEPALSDDDSVPGAFGSASVIDDAPAPLIEDVPAAADEAAPAAASAAAPTTVEAKADDVAELTAAGLVKRTPKKRSADATGGGMQVLAARGTGASQRSPEEVRKMLSRYRSGLNKGRGSADGSDTETPES